MLFKFKKSQVVVDSFTHHSSVFEHVQIAKGVNFLPQWWKDLKSDQPMNMKGCRGLIDFYSKSFILPLWSDLRLHCDLNNYGYQFPNNFFVAEQHDPIQHGDNFKEFNHLKLVNPWICKSKEDVKFSLVSPVWNLNKLMHVVHIMPGVVDFKYQPSFNVNIMLLSTVFDFVLPVNTPLYHIFPLTDKDVVFKSHLVSNEEWDKIKCTNLHMCFDKNYSEVKKLCKFNENKIK